MAKKIQPTYETMNQSIYRYNSPIDIARYTNSSDLEQSISKRSKKLKYCTKIESVYEVGYDYSRKESVIYAFPILSRYKLEWEESPSGLRVLEWS